MASTLIRLVSQFLFSLYTSLLGLYTAPLPAPPPYVAPPASKEECTYLDTVVFRDAR
jgi:hypothetical protein